jgi:hypothetical protein
LGTKGCITMGIIILVGRLCFDFFLKKEAIHLLTLLFSAGSYGGWDENGYFVGYNGVEVHPAVSYNNSVLHKVSYMPFLL